MLNFAGFTENFLIALVGTYKNQPEVMKPIAVQLLNNMLAGREAFVLIKDFFVQRYPNRSFPDFVVELLNYLDVSQRYEAATLFAQVRSAVDEPFLSSIWAQALVPTRCKELGADGRSITSDELQSYESNPLIPDAANRISFFALSGCLDTPRRTDLKILDVGCGSGLLSDFLKPFYSELVGLDIELGGLYASGRSKNYKSLLVGSAEAEINKLSNPLDLIISSCAVYYFKELDWLFQNAKRLLKPNGSLVFNGWPCPDDLDVSITAAGTWRLCHSERYLRSVSAKNGLILDTKLWKTCYNLPNYFFRFRTRN
jgi:SAM-dependent methyltransferase